MFSKAKKAHKATPTPSSGERDPNRLPKGAEAALWSIVETIPDPRNHLALTRDPTAEVRLSPRDLEAVRTPAITTPAITTPAITTPAITTPAVTVTPTPAVEAPLPRHEGVRWSVDTAEVRLPGLAGPYDLDGEDTTDASVHPIDPAPAPVDPARFAKGA